MFKSKVHESYTWEDRHEAVGVCTSVAPTKTTCIALTLSWWLLQSQTKTITNNVQRMFMLTPPQSQQHNIFESC